MVQTPITAQALPGEGARARTILVVEDEAMVREITVEVLRDAGYRVLAAEDGEAAEAVIAREGGMLDLLFTDIDLGPGATGLDLARAARVRRPDLPVIYASGGRGGLGLREGVDGSAFLAKPYGLDRVRHLIARALALPAAA